MTGTSPTARQRELGTKLRALRSEHGMTVEEVAGELLCSATKISRLETGTRRPSLRDVRDLCLLYKVDESTAAEFMSLAQEARAPAWWAKYEDLNLQPLLGLEQEATSITCYSMYYMPGLLQTNEYAHGIIKTVAPKMNPQVVRQRAEVRMLRQRLLDEDSRPCYNVLLDELVFRRGVGGPSLMSAQLNKTLKMARNGKASVQIIPFAAGAYAAADSYFVLLEFDEESNLWPMVYIEGLTDNQYLQREADISRYSETIEYLRDRALNPEDSIRFMESVREEYGRERLSAQSVLGIVKGLFVSGNQFGWEDIAWNVSRTCDGGQCIGVARQGDIVLIGNASNPMAAIGEFTVGEWRQFLAGAKLGDFDGIA